MTTGPADPKTILVVEDEAIICEMIADMMGDLGHHALLARDATTALAITAQTPDLMICDIGLPGHLRGGALAVQARERWPGLKVLFITGHGEPTRGPVELGPGTALLTKPFAIAALELSVSALLEGASPDAGSAWGHNLY